MLGVFAVDFQSIQSSEVDPILVEASQQIFDDLSKNSTETLIKMFNAYFSGSTPLPENFQTQFLYHDKNQVSKVKPI